MFKKAIIVFFIAAVALVVTGCTNEEPLKDEVIRDSWHESPLFQSSSYTMFGVQGNDNCAQTNNFCAKPQ